MHYKDKESGQACHMITLMKFKTEFFLMLLLCF